MSNAQRIKTGPSGFSDLLHGSANRQPLDAVADDLLWLGYEAAFPAAWMIQPSIGDEPKPGA